jgi:hypothetical protein
MVMSGMNPHLISGYGLGWFLVNVHVYVKKECVTTSFLVMCQSLHFVDCNLCGYLNY